MTAKKSAAAKSGAKSAGLGKNRTTATTKEAKATSSKSASKSRADAAAKDPRSLGFKDSKQQTALHQRSLATRNSYEGHGPESDAETQSGNEITSSAPPNVREEGHASSPSFEEVPVSGKHEGKGKPAGRLATDGSGSRSSSSARREGAEGEIGVTDSPRGKTVGPKHLPANLPVDIDAMEPGTQIEKFANEVRIRTAIAGGAVRIFSGPTYKDAVQQLHKFLRGDALVMPTASDAEARAVAEANEANVRALAEGTAKEKAAAKKTAAKKSSSKPRSKSGAKRK